MYLPMKCDEQDIKRTAATLPDDFKLPEKTKYQPVQDTSCCHRKNSHLTLLQGTPDKSLKLREEKTALQVWRTVSYT